MIRMLVVLRVVTCVALVLALGSCEQDMANQPRYDPYGEAALFPDDKVLQAPPPATVARDDPAWRAVYHDRPPLTTALLERGRDRYDIFCSPCHDYSGYGRGVVPSRGFPQPPSFHSERLRGAPSRQFFDVITNGYGVMYSYARRVPPDDRWAIAAYIRALQISQGARAAELPSGDRNALEPRSHRSGEGKEGAG
jgi:mono/diheme cytochrome c family protein